MSRLLNIADLRIRVTHKAVRNLHLSVNPPDGVVRITAPEWMEAESIRLFAINKLGWIRRQRQKVRAQERETPREYLEGESHHVWGHRYPLHVVEREAAAAVDLQPRRLVLQVRPGTHASKREAILYNWYRAQMRQALPGLLARWEPEVGRRAKRVFVQRMKTRWGSCNTRRGNIRLNSELARKPLECLEYVVVHELVHLREANHGAGFIGWMDRLLPTWRDRRDRLNRLPVRSER